MNRMMMKYSVALLAAMLAGSAWAADGNASTNADRPQQAEAKKPTQSQLALDHGPHAQVTPAVKRKRLEERKAVSGGT